MIHTQVTGADNEITAFRVEGYPYGRKRTSIRYWVESRPKKGQRFVSQTLNPKTQRWNNPKKSTYSSLIVMGLEKQEDGRDFVKWITPDRWETEAKLREFGETWELTDFQTKQLSEMILIKRASKFVKVSIKDEDGTPRQTLEEARKVRLTALRIAHIQLKKETDSGN